MRYIILFSIVLSQVSVARLAVSLGSSLGMAVKRGRCWKARSLTTSTITLGWICSRLHHLCGECCVGVRTGSVRADFSVSQSQNLQAFFMAVSNCATYIPIQYLILAQLIIFLREFFPCLFLSAEANHRLQTALAMIRNIQKLSGTALVADAFILFGLVYIFSNEIKVLADFGLADVKFFNSKDFPLLIG